MTHTISTTYNSLVTLSGAADNPTTITTTGLLEAGLYAGTLGAAWAITNAGSVLGAGMTLESAGAVVNAGSIAGNTTSGGGVVLDAGGSVDNQGGATISGYDGIIGFGALTVVNAGSIAGNYETNGGDGLALHAGGSVTNQNTGTISGRIGIYAGFGSILTCRECRQHRGPRHHRDSD